MKPLTHCKISVKKFGGRIEDYIDVHNFFDQTKAHIPDSRHRLILHNSLGIYLCEQVFGEMIQMPNGTFKKMPYITNSDGNQISVRDIAEQHVLDDLNHIPTLEKCMEGLKTPDFIAGGLKTLKLSSNVKLNIVD